MSERGVEFEAEVPVPQANLDLYRRIYVLEQWLRRMVMAALMSTYGTQWRNAIPKEMSSESRRSQSQARTFLDVEASDNVVWLLSLGELRQLMTADFLWPAVKELTGMQKADVAARVDELRQIRNVIGHNRATTAQTLRIFEGIELYLGRGIDRFRHQTLYENESEMFTNPSGDPLAAAVEAIWRTSPPRQVFLQRSEKFYAAVSLPIPPFTLMSVPDLVEAFHDVRHVILAIYVSGTNNEFSVVWPRGALEAEHQAVIAAFAGASAFTETHYVEQDPKYVCDPRVWFYFDELSPRRLPV